MFGLGAVTELFKSNGNHVNLFGVVDVWSIAMRGLGFIFIIVGNLK